MDDDDAPADASPSPSPSPASSSPLPVASALPVADPVTVAAAPPTGLLTVALPIQKPAASPHPGGGREDAWSEGATSALIDAWGERFVALGRGSLRHPQWQEVADAVSSRDGYSKAPKSDVQCKNRVDTLKKKCKIERPSRPPRGSSLTAACAARAHLQPQARRQPSRPQPSAHGAARGLPPAQPHAADARRRGGQAEGAVSGAVRVVRRVPAGAGAPGGEREEAEDGRGARGRRRSDRAQGLRELAQSIRRLGEAYERVETAKLEQAAEMERRRLDFARELESQRVQGLEGDLKEAAPEVGDGCSDLVVGRVLEPNLLQLPLLWRRVGLSGGRRQRRWCLWVSGDRGLLRRRRMGEDGGRRGHRGCVEGNG